MSASRNNLPPGCLPGDVDRSDVPPEQPGDYQKGCPCCGKAVDWAADACPVCKYEFEDQI